MFRNKINAEEKTPEQRKARILGLLQKEKERRDRLKELQIDYDFPGFSALVGIEKKKPVKAVVPEPTPVKAAAAKVAQKQEPPTKRETRQDK